MTGGAGNDTYNANYDAQVTAAHTLGGLDSLDGGAGINTLKITNDTGAYTMAAATIANIQKITIEGVAAITADVSGSNITGLESISTTKSTDVTITAGATTAVNVSGVAAGVFVNDGSAATDDVATATITGGSTQTVNVANKGVGVTLTKAAGAIDVTSSNNETLTDNAADTDLDSLSDITTTHGTTVTVNATLANDTATAKTAGAITVGDGTDNQSGAVSITQNLTSDGQATLAGGAISVNGGTTVNVTTNSTTVGKLGTSTSAITNGAVTVTADKNTTDVTVTQNKTVTATSTAAVGGVTESASVVFGALKEGDKLAIDGLVFTASKDLDGTQVAAAFANLISADRQSAGTIENGTYTVVTAGNYTSGAVSGSTVVFTSVTANAAVADLSTLVTLTNTSTHSVAPTYTNTQGAAVTTAATGPSTNAVTYGAVKVSEGGANSVKTVTVKGYTTADLGDTGADLDALTTLSLTNSAGTASVATAATTLGLTVNNINNIVTLDTTAATITNLTLNATGVASAFALTAVAVKNLTVDATVALDLVGSFVGSTANALENVTVKGAASVNLGAIANSTNLKTFDASANEGGVTATISAKAAAVHTDFVSYEFSKGNDVVTLSDVVVSKKINLGTGDDKITLASGTTALIKEIDGGTGSNIIAMDAADATTLSSDSAFEGKISNFQKLSIGATAAGDTDSIDLANMDDISYVISANAPANTTETGTYTFGQLLDGQAITLAGVTVRAIGATLTAIQVAESFDSAANGATPVAATANALVTGTLTGWSSADNAGAATVVFTSNTPSSNVADLDTLDSVAGLAAVVDVAASNPIEGDGLGTKEAFSTTMLGLLVGQSYTYLGIKITALVTMNATEVGTAFKDEAVLAGDHVGTSAKYAKSGDLTAPTMWGIPAITNVADVVTATNATDANITSIVAEFVAVGNTIVAAPALGSQSAYTPGNAVGSLTLTNMADNGTLELTAAGAGVTVTMKDAAGGTDTFNIVTKVTATNLSFGTATVANVETININANDSQTDTTKGQAVNTSTMTLAADKATTVNVEGSSALNLTLTATKVTSVDAHLLNGSLTLTANGATAGTTVLGGTAADTLTSSGENDVLKGNDGNDTFTATDLAQLWGGNGSDTFNFLVHTNLTKVSTINDIGSGDVINLKDVYNAAGAATVVTKFYAAGAQYDADTTTDVAGKVNAALAQTGESEATWFQHLGNTYIVIDANDASNVAAGAVDTYIAGQDIVIKLVGTIDLSTAASFNATVGTLEFL